MNRFAVPAFTALAMLAAPPALACRQAPVGIVFEKTPEDVPAGTLILDVTFEDTSLAVLENGARTEIGRARIHRVIGGDYDKPTIDVLIRETSCSLPPESGERGVIIGLYRKLDDGSLVLSPWSAPKR